MLIYGVTITAQWRYLQDFFGTFVFKKLTANPDKRLDSFLVNWRYLINTLMCERVEWWVKAFLYLASEGDEFKDALYEEKEGDDQVHVGQAVQ